ncbi:S-adenosyl-L-methionine-dependent methyltransferase [Xylaria flabelliformis]|nr:S-adenosyl-L-methionine-dependent methyltransferase [Xylaria flabelliformis]
MNTEEKHDRSETYKTRKTPPRQKRNPIETAISSWYESHAAHLTHQYTDLIAQAPKRWTAYGSLALLPAGSFTSAAWCEVLKSTAEGQGPALLWKTILAEISGLGATKLTHLAVNEGIPLHSKDSNSKAAGEGEKNILRSPGGLRMLYGDFGPGGEEREGKDSATPTEDDFARAFWISTKQNGITQTWAPRWTMFSRGNVKEKARLLRFHDPPKESGAMAVDLYAGIGYFAFSYAASGFRKVFCWELNPWSVEGLRRGAVANGWSVRVIREKEEEEMLKEILEGDETIIVFLEDNARAADRLRRLDQLSRERDGEEGTSPGFRMSSIMHVNLGLLPTSQLSWTTAWEIASESRRAWFHIHENVGVADIDAKKGEIRKWFAARAQDGVRTNDFAVEHVDLVKTFAPGVWHCVFDLCVRRGTDGGPG